MHPASIACSLSSQTLPVHPPHQTTTQNFQQHNKPENQCTWRRVVFLHRTGRSVLGVGRRSAERAAAGRGGRPPHRIWRPCPAPPRLRPVAPLRLGRRLRRGDAWYVQQKNLHLVHHDHSYADRAALSGVLLYEYCLSKSHGRYPSLLLTLIFTLSRELLNNCLSTNQGRDASRAVRRLVGTYLRRAKERALAALLRWRRRVSAASRARRFLVRVTRGAEARALAGETDQLTD